MLSSTVLEVAVGLVFSYASISLVTSTVYEAFASVLKLRASSLLKGVKAMLNDQAFTGLAKDLYNHALVNPRHDGRAESGRAPAVKPSYIDPKSFSLALLDVIQKGPATFAELKVKIDQIENAQLKQLLEGMYARADGKIENVETALASWFDDSMQRVSGAYKRMTQLWTFLIGLAVAALFNFDTFRLFRTLWDHPALIARVATPGGFDAAQAVAHLDALPLGWDPAPPSLPLAFVGWLVTALSVLFGAPFWFDLLERLVNLRGTGQRPSERQDPKPAKGSA